MADKGKVTQIWEVTFNDGTIAHVDDDKLKEIMKDAGLIYLTPEEVVNTKMVVGAKLTDLFDADWVEPEPENGGDN